MAFHNAGRMVAIQGWYSRRQGPQLPAFASIGPVSFVTGGRVCR